MEEAFLHARRSTCERGQVGAVAILGGRVISSGYNGSLPGQKECDQHCDLTEKCTRTLHAEGNLIAYAAKKGLSIEGATLYITLSPCSECAKLIAQAGIRTVIYEEKYRTTTGLVTLKELGVGVVQYIRKG